MHEERADLQNGLEALCFRFSISTDNAYGPFLSPVTRGLANGHGTSSAILDSDNPYL